MAPIPKLYGIAEIGAALDVPRRTVAQWRHRHQMPEPDWELAMGPVWKARTIEPFIEARRKARSGTAA